MKNIQELIKEEAKYMTLYCSQMPIIPEDTAKLAMQKCPDAILPHLYMTQEHIQEEDNPISPYLYIEVCRETKKHNKVLGELQKALRGYNISSVGFLKGSDHCPNHEIQSNKQQEIPYRLIRKDQTWGVLQRGRPCNQL